MKNKQFGARLGFALSGFFLALKQENSFRFQIFSTIAVTVMLIVLQPALIWWALVVVMIAMVLMAELFNTALETLCDYVQPEHHEAIGKIKDLAAAAVLMASIGSLIVAVLLIIDLID